MQNKNILQSIALHEAGHFIVSLITTYDPPYLTKIFDNLELGICQPIFDGFNFETGLLISLAGHAAEIYGETPIGIKFKLPEDTADDDFFRAMQECQEYFKLPKDNIVIQSCITYHFLRAQYIVEKYWNCVQDVSSILLNEKEIDYMYALKLVKKWSKTEPDFAFIHNHIPTIFSEQCLKTIHENMKKIIMVATKKS